MSADTGGMGAARRRQRSVSPERIAKVVSALAGCGVATGVRLNVDGSAELLTGAGPVVLSGDPVEDELAAWRAKRDGQGGPARRL